MAWASKSGAWAQEVDEAEEKKDALGPAPPEPKLAAVPLALGGEEAFPSLGEAVTKKISKRDRKAKQTVSLKDFQSGAYKAPRPSSKPASDVDILASLPSAPRARDDDDVRPTMGGAFREYGGDRGGRGGDRDGDRERGGRFGGRSGGGFGGSQDGSQDGFDPDAPARADVSDDWGKDRKFVSSGGGGDRGRSGGGGDEDREPLGPSRADESRSWGADRKPFEAAGGGSDRGGASRGFGGDRDRDRDADRDLGPSRADTEDRWGAKKFTPSEPPARGGGGGGFGGGGGNSEDRWGGSRRSGGGFDDGDRGGPRSGSPTGAPAAGSRPRLNLAKRTLPAPEVKVAESAAAGPLSTASSESAEPGMAGGDEPAEPAGPPKPKVNPFGAARPREEVLKEQGRDARHEELQRKAVDRPETDEERELRERIEALRARVDAGEGAARVAPAAGADPEPEPAAEDVAAMGASTAEKGAAGAATEAAENGVESGAEGRAAERKDGAPKDTGATEEGPEEGGAKEGGAKEGEAEVGRAARTVEEELAELEEALRRLSAEGDDRVRFSRAGGRRDNW